VRQLKEEVQRLGAELELSRSLLSAHMHVGAGCPRAGPTEEEAQDGTAMAVADLGGHPPPRPQDGALAPAAVALSGGGAREHAPDAELAWPAAQLSDEAQGRCHAELASPVGAIIAVVGTSEAHHVAAPMLNAIDSSSPAAFAPGSCTDACRREGGAAAEEDRRASSRRGSRSTLCELPSGERGDDAAPAAEACGESVPEAADADDCAGHPLRMGTLSCNPAIATADSNADEANKRGRGASPGRGPHALHEVLPDEHCDDAAPAAEACGESVPEAAGADDCAGHPLRMGTLSCNPAIATADSNADEANKRGRGASPGRGPHALHEVLPDKHCDDAAPAAEACDTWALEAAGAEDSARDSLRVATLSCDPAFAAADACADQATAGGRGALPILGPHAALHEVFSDEHCDDAAPAEAACDKCSLEGAGAEDRVNPRFQTSAGGEPHVGDAMWSPGVDVAGVGSRATHATQDWLHNVVIALQGSPPKRFKATAETPLTTAVCNVRPRRSGTRRAGSQVIAMELRGKPKATTGGGRGRLARRARCDA